MEGLGLPPPELTEQELEVVTTVFRNYETGLREATIFPKVGRYWKDNQTLHGLEVFKMPTASFSSKKRQKCFGSLLFGLKDQLIPADLMEVLSLQHIFKSMKSTYSVECRIRMIAFAIIRSKYHQDVFAANLQICEKFLARSNFQLLFWDSGPRAINKCPLHSRFHKTDLTAGVILAGMAFTYFDRSPSKFS